MICDLLEIFEGLTIENQRYSWYAMNDFGRCQCPFAWRSLWFCRSAWVLRHSLRRRAGFGMSACSPFERFDAATQLAKFLAYLKNAASISLTSCLRRRGKWYSPSAALLGSS